MSRDPSKTLSILFGLEKSTIDQDIRAAEIDLVGVANEISSLVGVPFDAKTPEIEARLAHLLMVQAYALCQRDGVPPEVKTFYAAFGAGGIVQDAESAAADKDTLARLSSEMEVIRRREGLSEDEFWMRNEGPADYEKLEDQYGQVLEKIEDTVFTFALRRYHLDEQANLFEQDRLTFEMHREIGRRVIFHPREDAASIEKLLDDYFLKEYGADALRRVELRVNELRAKQPRRSIPGQ